MGLLGRLGAITMIAIVGCYTPDVRNCTVSCGVESDCAAGQTCGADHFCAAPEIAGHCVATATTDGGTGPAVNDAVIDATAPDADIPTDAIVAVPDASPPAIHLHIVITGRGRVLAGAQSCDSNGSQHGNCLVTVLAGASQTLHAVAEAHWQFQAWTTAVCAGQGATCMFTPTADTFVGVEFQDQNRGGD